MINSGQSPMVYRDLSGSFSRYIYIYILLYIYIYIVIHCAGFGSLRSDSSDYDDAERSCQACVQNVSKCHQSLKESTNSIQHMSYLEIPMRFLVLPSLVFFFFSDSLASGRQ